VPLAQVGIVGAHRDLRVDRRRSTDAAAGDERDRPRTPVGRRHREADRPPEVVRGLGLPSREVVRATVGAELEQQHRAPALRELSGDDAAARAGADHDHVDVLAHLSIRLTIRSRCPHDPFT